MFSMLCKPSPSLIFHGCKHDYVPETFISRLPLQFTWKLELIVLAPFPKEDELTIWNITYAELSEDDPDLNWIVSCFVAVDLMQYLKMGFPFEKRRKQDGYLI